MDITKLRPNLREWVIGGFIGLAWVVQGWAVDRYVVEGPASMIVGGSESIIKVTPLSAEGVDNSLHEIEFTNLPIGVDILPVDPARGMAVAGPTDFRVTVGAHVRPDPFGPVCQKKGEPTVVGSATILLEKPVSRFILVTLPRSVEKPDLIQLQITALDDRGFVVTSYRGDLTLRSSAGSLESDLLLGERFHTGVAVAPIRFRGSAPVGVLRVSVEERTLGPGRTVPAGGELSVKVK